MLAGRGRIAGQLVPGGGHPAAGGGAYFYCLGFCQFGSLGFAKVPFRPLVVLKGIQARDTVLNELLTKRTI